MPGRLLEVEKASSGVLFSWIKCNVRNIVLYGYGDWIGRFGGIQQLCAAARIFYPENASTLLHQRNLTAAVRVSVADLTLH